LGNRSYRVVALALVLAALFLAPFVASVIHAQTIAASGQGVVFTKVVGVGGNVAFFFNPHKLRVYWPNHIHIPVA